MTLTNMTGEYMYKSVIAYPVIDHEADEQRDRHLRDRRSHGEQNHRYDLFAVQPDP